MGTKAPYYGNIAIAAFLNPGLSSDAVSVAHVPLAEDNERSSAYAAFQGEDLVRLLVVNLQAYNSTLGGTGTSPDPDAPVRPRFQYAFAVPWQDGKAQVQRLHAGGSDAISGITWDGWSYNYELEEGKPVRLDNVTVGETVEVRDGQVQVDVAASEAVILSRVVGCSRWF